MKSRRCDRTVRQSLVSKGATVHLSAVVQRDDYTLLVRPKAYEVVPYRFDLVTIPYTSSSSVFDALRAAVLALTSLELQRGEHQLGSYERWDVRGALSKILAFRFSCNEGPIKIVDHAEFAWVNHSCIEDYLIETDVKSLLLTPPTLNVAA